MRNRRLNFVTSIVLLAFAMSPDLWAAPEVLEVGPAQRDQLPRGKEADGIQGDFLLRNDRVEAVISQNAPLRRANMSTFYGETGITPGCLYDLTLRGTNNDQITVFAPANQRGRVSYVRIVDDGRQSGEAAVETVTTAANNDGLYKRHVYRLRDGWPGVRVSTTIRNEGGQPFAASVADRWTVFRRNGAVRGITWADAIDPADKAGYATGPVGEGAEKPLDTTHGEVDLKPGQEVALERFLAAGRSPLEAVGEVLAQRGETGQVSGLVKDAGGAPVATASLNVKIDGNPIPAYPDAEGRFAFRLPPGDYEVLIEDIGREPVKKTVSVKAGEQTSLDVEMAVAAAIEFDVTDADAARGIPCKVQFIGQGGTANPDLGPHDRAHGCANQYHSEKGNFRVQVPLGKYKVVVTHGIEYSHVARDVTVEPGGTQKMQAALRRLVQTPGWVSTDYHNHSTQSGDNTCGTDDRIINLAAEQIEFAPATEHNRIYNWRPHIERLGLAHELSTITGMELTGGGAHLNSFPLEPVPFTQDHGAPVWNKDPRINAAALRHHRGDDADRWVHINHPDLIENFIDRDADRRPDDGFVALGQLVDAVETQNFIGNDILATAPYAITRNKVRQEVVDYSREFIWLQLLNAGQRLTAIAVSDAHSVYGNGVGGWRTYVPSATDNPAEIDWKELSRHSKAGRMMLTTGPFLEVKTDDGTLPGGTVTRSGAGAVRLHVRVQCTDWIDIDRVQVLVNGRQVPELNFTRKANADAFAAGVVKFDRTIEVPVKEDAHLIVVAYGEQFDLSTGYGSSPQSGMRPCAYHNPIFIDADGNGFRPNGDTLGFPLPTKKLTVDEAKAALREAGVTSPPR